MQEAMHCPRHTDTNGCRPRSTSDWPTLRVLLVLVPAGDQTNVSQLLGPAAVCAAGHGAGTARVRPDLQFGHS